GLPARLASSWPQPPDIGRLRELQQRGLALSIAAKARRITLTPVADVAVAGGWWAVPSGTTPTFSADAMIRGLTSDPLTPGRFDVYLCQRRDAGQYPFGATAIRVATAADMRRGP